MERALSRRRANSRACGIHLSSVISALLRLPFILPRVLAIDIDAVGTASPAILAAGEAMPGIWVSKLASGSPCGWPTHSME